ncbi:hypothetical protein VE01_01849 [Pseudogymnoascus verrucosus]|uniref:RING-type domain-containing protein n=1 Tax=Pseudogymnoascus verrucosus TaxID=342668 RepID=A0A1B8GWJ3_9PEZI|nr:uncharacterized protein VE01_01849 [Pseudogymnoascus verrucosus]OBU00197.1 hypothetical protein VE01_01849 [Pseudogymnoascus verrucosus]
MASYEVEHNIQPTTTPSTSRRPDMSTFFSKLSQINLDPLTHNNPHAQPTPVDMRATFSLLADSYYQIRSTTSGPPAELLTSLITELEETADSPPKEVEGVSQAFLDSLERVDRKKLKEESCPICGERFRDDEYPLVVVLPCHPGHWFDLECVGPWLRLKGTCPLDRKAVGERKKVVVVEDSEEEDYDDMIA